MQPPKLKFSWKSVLFPLLGLFGFFLYIYVFQVNILGIFATAKTANPLIYSIAILFGLFQVLFFTVSWRVLTNYLSIKMTIVRAYLYVWYGMYVDTIVPAQSISGEVTRTYLLTRDGCGSFGKVVASLYTHRLLGTTINAFALIAGIVLLSVGGSATPPLVFNLIIFVAAVIIAILVLMTVLSFKQQWTLKGINGVIKFAQKFSIGKNRLQKLRDRAVEITRHFVQHFYKQHENSSKNTARSIPKNANNQSHTQNRLEKLKEQAVELTSHFHDSMKEFRHNPRTISYSLFYLLISWFFSLSVPYLVFVSLGHPVSWSIILVTSAIFLAVKSIPVGIPFEVGLPEAVMTTLYISMGVPGALSATATILTRIITLWLFFIIGFGSQQWLELKPAISRAANTEKIKIDPLP